MRHSNKGLSRRDFFKRFINKTADEPDAIIPESPTVPDAPIVDSEAEDVVAIIQAKYCWAYEDIDCSRCVDVCPEPNVIVVEDGLPRIEVEGCTGCRLCQDICPGPADAILMVDRFTP